MAAGAERANLDRELTAAQADLHATLNAVGRKVEAAERRLQPRHLVENHPVLSTCAAAVLGFSMGAGSDRPLFRALAIGALAGCILAAAFADRGEGRADDRRLEGIGKAGSNGFTR